MKMKFLCDNHLNWLTNRPKETQAAWERAMETGAYHQDLKLWRESIAPFGCAYELATMMINQDSELSQETMNHFSETAKRLVFSLIQMGEEQAASDTIDQVRAFFNRRKLFQHQKRAWEMIRMLRMLLIAGSQANMDAQSTLPPSVTLTQPHLQVH